MLRAKVTIRGVTDSDRQRKRKRTHGPAARKEVENHVREAISRGDMAPGHRLVESDLMEMFGMTRNGVRLALDALIADGLVERIPNKSARVRLVTTDEAVAIMECRMVLDGLLSRRAAEYGTEDQFERLLANRDLMRDAVADNRLTEYSELIQQHHALVREMAHQPVAAGLVEHLHGQIVRHQFQLSLRAIVKRDREQAEATARAHLQGVIDAVVGESVEARR
jgi:DNA-binding GntR family transcriptional regulator